ncbi:septum site-determining protein MinC [Thermus sp. 2.9]|uniref:septum site-determining protein MinC n=1 Tax=Thermus sp. (strain 2.9) TaxID=1577051 RepID=UPI000542C683|nr:septum site-determining protein MinC [Thermus sp. 2.9]KHG65584.1 septum site-determining protein MinC [Thermus sp. 2.9]
MRLRATPKALALRLDGGESPEDLARLTLPEGLPLEVEVAGPVSQEVLQALLALGRPLTLVPARSHKSLGTLVVGKTLRAGERVEHPGTVVVLGDVNPGAEVVAGGDVIVVGKLRGLAHAGAGGDEERFIFALSLAAKQLRIGPHLAQAPEGEEATGPELARVVEGRIVVEPWSRRRLPPTPPRSA